MKCVELELKQHGTNLIDSGNIKAESIELQDDYVNMPHEEIENDSLPDFEDIAYQKAEKQCVNIEMNDRKENLIKVECIEFENDEEIENMGVIKCEFK